MKKFVCMLGIVGLLVLPASRSAYALVVQGFDDSRSLIGPISGESFSFVTGPPYADARSLLTSNFAGITFLSGVPEVTPASLQGVDVFVISPLNLSLSQEEICALETFVNNGGALLEVRNLGNRPPILGTVPGPASSEAFPTIVNPSSPLVDGLFGTVGSVKIGFHFSFLQLGDAVAVTENTDGPNIIQLSEGSGRNGRAVFIGDEAIFMTGTVPDEHDGHLDNINFDNQTLLLNTFAFLAGAPGLDPNADFFSACGIVEIDIKPGSNPNCFNNDGNGVIPVAILGSASFDVTEIDAAMVLLEGMAVKAVGKSNKLLASIEDVNGDLIDDLVVKIEDTDGVFSAGDTTATVSGNLLPAFGSTAFQGTDTICIVGNAAPALNPRSKLTTTWARMKAKR